MKHPVLAPSVGESITEVSILKWSKPDGAAVKVGEMILEIESDKATVELVAENAGVLRHLKPAGERIPVGAQIGEIDDAATPAGPTEEVLLCRVRLPSDRRHSRPGADAEGSARRASQ